MKKRVKRSIKGFTLIELLVVVIIIGILAAIALPNFIGVEGKAREASVKANMRTTQIAAESYATDNGGTYDGQVDVALESYFPGGSNDGTSAGHAPVNPFTNQSAWTDYISNSKVAVATVRTTAPAASGKTAGQVLYGPGDTAVTTYAIEGVGSTGNLIAGQAAQSTLVLSNE